MLQGLEGLEKDVREVMFNIQSWRCDVLKSISKPSRGEHVDFLSDLFDQNPFEAKASTGIPNFVSRYLDKVRTDDRNRFYPRSFKNYDQLTENFSDSTNKSIGLVEEVILNRTPLNGKIRENLSEFESGLQFQIIFTNSMHALSQAAKSDSLGVSLFPETFMETLTTWRAQTGDGLSDDDAISSYPEVINSIATKFCVVKVSVKLSQFHQERLTDIATKFPTNKCAVQLQTTAIDISHERQKHWQGLVVKGQAELNPTDVDIRLYSDLTGSV